MTGCLEYSCLRCGLHQAGDIPIDSGGCGACRPEAASNLRLVPLGGRSGAIAADARAPSLPSLWRYADRLPCSSEDAVSLGEGLTPLIDTIRLGKRLGLRRLYIKDESRNPTWSHKDRFSAVAVSMAKRRGVSILATASSGNAGASLAAYAAKAGLKCIVATFAGGPAPMMAQIRKAGGIIVPFAQKPDRWEFIAEGVERHGWFATSPFRAPVVGSHPLGIEGYKTLAYEIAEQLDGEMPDWCVLPVCYGDALAGMWWGFQELFDERLIERLPRLVAAEIHGSLMTALARTSDRLPNMAAKASSLALSIGATQSTFQALLALRQSDGKAVAVGDADLIAWQEMLATEEGVFAELASVTPFAAIAAMRENGLMKADASVVAVVTASGLKDVDLSMRMDTAVEPFRSVRDAWNALPLGAGPDDQTARQQV
ncbi:MAG: pyridoxal-phosphate dependent enzyme [Paracoccus denitrificans]|uniref:Pyridoxal-phosphate dependent enzyme n=1 Tax=Paracoccus denitrificans TaxID=266 RepID=A0A533I357_PARDE|nr:MAG: pyridoxal-phosphate dependent enzyme [Paracoccus denitrificans]